MTNTENISLRQKVRNLAIGETLEVSSNDHKRSVVKQTAYNIAKDYGTKYRTFITSTGMTVKRVS